MPKKTCPNGHVYDTSIYGDQCPMCPAQSAGTATPGATVFDTASMNNAAPTGGAGAHTHIAGPANVPIQGYAPSNSFGNPVANSVVGETHVRPNEMTPDVQAAPANAPQTAHTVIRRAPGTPGAKAVDVTRRLVGFLVTYNRTPNGKAYNLYEGRNYIGRDSKCDICIPDDEQLSGTHMSIMFRNIDKKFKFRDEQSSNGTFINKELLDDGELKNYDIIRVGGTLFIFMAIPLI